MSKTDRGSPPGVPRWVKVSGIIALILLVLFGLLHLTGNGLGGHTLPTGHAVHLPWP